MELVQRATEWMNINPAHVGLDIDATSIIIVQLRKQADRFVLEQVNIKTLPKDTIDEDRIQTPSVITKLISEAKTESNLSPTQISIAAPANFVATAYGQISKHSTDIQKEALARAEIRKTFPNIYKDLYYDFVVLDSETPEKETNLSILLVAARKDEMEPRLKAIQSAGLQVKALQVEYYALEQA